MWLNLGVLWQYEQQSSGEVEDDSFLQQVDWVEESYNSKF